MNGCLLRFKLDYLYKQQKTPWPCLVDGKVKLARKMILRKMNPRNVIPNNFAFLCLENSKILNFIFDLNTN